MIERYEIYGDQESKSIQKQKMLIYYQLPFMTPKCCAKIPIIAHIRSTKSSFLSKLTEKTRYTESQLQMHQNHSQLLNIQMNFNMEDAEFPIISVLNFEQAKLDIGYPIHDDDKCNLHILNRLFQQKRDIKKKDRVKKPLEAGQLVGHWNIIEKKRYHWFLEMYHDHFENKQLRRMDKIFKSMATFIGTRAADQCRSHHQKMEKKYKTFYNIIYNLRLNHYNTAQIGDMIQDFTSHGVTSPNSLIDSFPQDFSVAEAKLQPIEVKEEEGVQQNIHYNFFGEREYEYGQHAFSGMTP